MCVLTFQNNLLHYVIKSLHLQTTLKLTVSQSTVHTLQRVENLYLVQQFADCRGGEREPVYLKYFPRPVERRGGAG